MGLRDVPVAQRRGLLVVGAHVDAELHLLELGGEIEIGRRSQHRIALDDDQRVHLAGGHRIHQLAQRGQVIDRFDLDRWRVHHRAADILERLIDRVPQCVDGGRLLGADDHDARSAMRLQVARDGGDPAGMRLGQCVCWWRGHLDTQLAGEGARHIGDPAGRHAQPMVGHGAGDRERALDRIQAVHGRLVLAHPPAVAELAGIAQVARVAVEEVRIQREDAIGGGKMIDRVHVLTERELRACQHIAQPGRLVLMPARLGELLEQRAQLRTEGWRRHRLGQDPQPGALSCPQLLQPPAEHIDEILPSRDLAQVRHRLGSIGVVERQHRGLGERITGPQAIGVVGVALDLGRAPQLALGQQPDAVAAQRHGRREVERPTRRDAGVGLLNVGDDLLARLRTGAQACQRQRGRHELQKRSAAHGVAQLGGPSRELAREELLELAGLGQLLEATPILLTPGSSKTGADRVQVDRLVLHGPRLYRWQT